MNNDNDVNNLEDDIYIYIYIIFVTCMHYYIDRLHGPATLIMEVPIKVILLFKPHHSLVRDMVNEIKTFQKVNASNDQEPPA